MDQYASEIHRFVDEWLRAHGTNWEGLRKQAGVSAPVGTDIRRGSTPRPETLRKLADAMEVFLYRNDDIEDSRFDMMTVRFGKGRPSVRYYEDFLD